MRVKAIAFMLALAAGVSGAIFGAAPTWAQQTKVEALYADLAKLPMAERQQRIEEGAKAEGQLNVIHSWRGDQAVRHIALFTKRYPFVKVNFTDLGAMDATEHMVTEETASRHLTDVITTGVDEGVPALPYAASYPTPMLDRILPQWKDLIYPHNLMIPFYWSEHGISYNPTVIPANLIPKSWDDLCNPGLKGEASYEPTNVYFLNGLNALVGEEHALNLIKCIGANQPILQRGNTQRLELMIAGDHWLQGDNYIYNCIMRKDKDPSTPCNVDWDVPIFGAAGTAMINKNTPHPYASALFTDWLLSEESQKFANDEYRNPIAVPNTHFPKDAKTVSYGVMDPKITDRLVAAWNQYVLKR